MLYYLFKYLESEYQFPGATLFEFISFRAAIAIFVSLLISTVYGRRIIDMLRTKQMGESIRELGLQGQAEKAGTPTMGGIIIILATLIPVLLFARLDNIYIILLIVTTIWMGAIGFTDDYLKIKKKDKAGLAGKFKIVGQVGLGLIVGCTMYFNEDITIKEEKIFADAIQEEALVNDSDFNPAIKSTKTTIPFIKNNEFDYSSLITWISPDLAKYAWLVFIPIVILIVTAVSNGANLTDGIDGLAAGSSAIIVLTLALFAWVSGNIIFSDYLNVMYIPNTGEITIFIMAFCGSTSRFSLVQHVSRTGVYGRYREFNHWRNHRCDCYCDQKRIPDTDYLWNFF